MALTAYWAHSPPVHISVARYLGIKPKSAARGLAGAGPGEREASDALIAQTTAMAGPMRKFVPPIPIH